MHLCYSDLHVHTNRSFCAPPTSLPELYPPVCAEEGIQVLGLVNHTYLPQQLASRNINVNSGGVYAAGLREEVESIRTNTSVQILVGCEVETIFGMEPGLNKEEAHLFDYVLLAPSHIMNLPWAYEGVDISTPSKMRNLLVEQFKRACLLEFDVPTGICHPLYPIGCPWEQEVVDGISDAQLEECFSLAAARNISIEIHSCLCRNGTQLDEEGISFSYMRMFSIAKSCGCHFHFGSDAHAVDTFIGAHRTLERVAQRLELQQKNLWPLISRLVMQ